MFTPDTKLDIQRFKKLLVEKGSPKYSYGWLQDLGQHIEMLEKEFSGKTQLELFHASTIVFIRRKRNLKQSVDNFKQLWALEPDFLCKKLDARWLISACDTMIDHSENPEEVAFAASASLFMNTIRLYETERFICHCDKKLQAISGDADRIDLFDGLACFKVGYGDAVKNIYQRINNLSSDSAALKILQELLARINKFETVYKRLLGIHVNEKTRW